MGTHRQRRETFWAGAMLALGLGLGLSGCPGDTELAKGDGANQGDGSSGSGGGDSGANGGGVSGSGASGSGSGGTAGAGASGSSGGGHAGSGSTAGNGGTAGGAAGSGSGGGDTCPPGIAIPTICKICPEGCGQPVCKDGAFTGDFACAGGGDAGSGGGAGSGSGDSGGCVHGGCSSQLCLEASVADTIASTCEFREEYACYQAAECARQADGECGFTESQALSDCLADAGSGGGLHWQTTCGDPVCSSQPDPDDPSVPNCTDQMIPGSACDNDGATCETGACGGHLVCSADAMGLVPCPSG